jgi:hypothetical protein
MADARHAPCPSGPSSQPLQGDARNDGWRVVQRRKNWLCLRRPPPPRQPIPTDLVGRCFNCLQPDHVTVVYTFPSQCLRCCREGHQAAEIAEL